jgi:hypothetical protein
MCAEKCNISVATTYFLIKFYLGVLKIMRHFLGMLDIFFGLHNTKGHIFFHAIFDAPIRPLIGDLQLCQTG